jgi:DNA-binding IclR family transcriptional regulator
LLNLELSSIKWNRKMGILENSTAVLRLITQLRKGVTVSDVVQHLNFPKSSASRILGQMAGQGLLERDRNTLAYHPALMLLELAHLVRGSTTLVDLADRALDELCAQTGHTGYISVLGGNDVMVLRVHPGAHALRVVTYPGHRIPAWATSTGRALLAREPDDLLLQRFPAGLPPVSAAAPDSVGELLHRVGESRSRGWALALDESLPGIGSVACAVGDPATGETLAFCLTFPSSMSSQSETTRLAALLCTKASELGRLVGDPFWQARSSPASA